MDNDFKCLVIMLRSLKCLGLCPFEKQSKLEKVQYKFAWNSKQTVLSLLAASVIAFVYFIALTHVGLQQYFIFGPGRFLAFAIRRLNWKPNVRNSSHMSQSQIAAHLSVFTAVQIITTGQYFGYLWASWRNRNILPRFLNDAISLADMTHWPAIKTKFDHRVISIVALLYGFTSALVPGYLVGSSITAHQDFVIEFIFSGLVLVYVGVVELGHDTCVVFAFRHLHHNFRQIRRCIQAGYAPNGKTLDKWENAIHSIRQQVCLLSIYLAPVQLISLMQTIAMSTLCTFSALMIARISESKPLGESNEDKSYIFGNLLCTIYLLGRLYCKVSLAQQVTNEEAQLALELGRLSVKDQEVAFKVKRLVDMMTCKPCEINLSDLVVMRKRLFLETAGQISTYLVVITQFYQSE